MRSARLVVLGVCLLIAACSGGGTKRLPSPTTAGAPAQASTAPATPTPIGTLPPVTRTIANCPVDREICDFALKAETWVREGDVRSLVAPGSAWDTPNELAVVLGSIQGTLPVVGHPIRLASIGCPLVNDAGDCSEAFSLAFTTLTFQERSESRGYLTLGFKRRPGPMPALTSVGAPQGDDRLTATAFGGTSIGCALSGATPKTESECIRTVFRLVQVERTAPPGGPPDCPLLPPLCEFALKTEAALAARDFATVGGALAADLAEAVKGELGGAKPRLVTIGCPFGPTQVWCTGPFSLGFTTADPKANWTTTGGILVLQFEQGTSPPKLEKLTPVPLSEPSARRAVLFGGIAAGMCELAGRSPATPPGGGGCSGPAVFEAYWSHEPFPSQSFSKATVLTPGLPEPPPPNTALFVVTGCWQCDGPDETLQRHVTDAAGKLTTTTLLENGKGPLAGWTIGEIKASPDGKLVAAKVCDIGYCGPLGSEMPLATQRVIWSADGGLTWTEAWRGTAYRAFIQGMTAAGVVIHYIDRSTGGYTDHYAVVSTTGDRRHAATRELAPPSTYAFPLQPVLLSDGHVFWIAMDENGLMVGNLLAEDGSKIPTALPGGASAVRGGGLPDGRFWLLWQETLPPRLLFGVFDLNGRVHASYQLDAAFRVDLALATAGVGNLALQGGQYLSSSLPLLLELANPPKVLVIGAPFGSKFGGRNRLIAATTGPFARVKTGPDCLNVREQPSKSSTSLGCFADGVLFRMRGEPDRNADAMTWVAVETPDARPGWASADYLAR